MIIETKYSIDDVVYSMAKGNVTEATITRISLAISAGEADILYALSSGYSLRSKSIFGTAEECVTHWMKEQGFEIITSVKRSK